MARERSPVQSQKRSRRLKALLLLFIAPLYGLDIAPPKPFHCVRTLTESKAIGKYKKSPGFFPALSLSSLVFSSTVCFLANRVAGERERGWWFWFVSGEMKYCGLVCLRAGRGFCFCVVLSTQRAERSQA